MFILVSFGGEMGAPINEVMEPASIHIQPVPTASVFIRKTALPHYPVPHLGSQPFGTQGIE